MSWISMFRHIPTEYDDDPCAGEFVCCKGCGHWTDVRMFTGDSCECCGRIFDGSEDSQCGRYPPGWEDCEMDEGGVE